MKKFLRYLGLTTGVLVLLAAGFFGWAWHSLREAGGVDSWHRDGPPEESSLRRYGFEHHRDSIYRLVEVGHSFRWNGDGAELVISCFRREHVPQVLSALQDSQPGFPKDSWWRSTIQSKAPDDLKIPDSADPSHYRHLTRQNGWTIIDIVRGITYSYTFRT